MWKGILGRSISCVVAVAVTVSLVGSSSNTGSARSRNKHRYPGKTAPQVKRGKQLRIVFTSFEKKVDPKTKVAYDSPQLKFIDPQNHRQECLIDFDFYPKSPYAGAILAPDGRRLFFVTGLYGESAQSSFSILHSMNIDGTSLKDIAEGKIGEFTLSLDGKKIAYMQGIHSNSPAEQGLSPGELYSLWTMNSDGSDQRRIKNIGEDLPDYYPHYIRRDHHWFPSDSFCAGKKVWSERRELTIRSLNGSETVMRDEAGWRVPPVSDIYIANTDGSHKKRLTHTRQPGWGNIDPSFSPDGKQVVWASNRDGNISRGGNYEICVMNSDGSGQTRLTRNKVDDYFPHWHELDWNSLRKSIRKSKLRK